MTIALVSLLAAAIGCSDAISPNDGLTAKALGLTEVADVAGSGEAVLLANFSSPSSCLTAGRSGDQAFIDSCDVESQAQTLTWDADGTITTAGGLCLEATGAGNGDPVIFSGCTGGSAQLWSASSDEQIVSAGGACLDLERRGGGSNSAVVWSCGGRSSQGWGALGGDESADEPAEDPTDDPADDPADDPITTSAGIEGVWIGADEISQLPTSGAAWDALLRDAERDPGVADVADQNSAHDTRTLAAALVCRRTGEHCDKARRGVLDAIGTEEDARWLAVGRNLMSYVIAADLLGLRADGDPNSDGTRVQEWIASFQTIITSVETTQMIPFGCGSNACAQIGAAYAALAVYLGDQTVMDRVWDAFRTFAGDPNGPDHENIDIRHGIRYGWSHVESTDPATAKAQGATAINPKGSSKDGVRIDGAIINDMRRGGEFADPPGYTQYPWVGLEGFVPAALILHRAGYPAFEVADRAVLRTHEYLWYLREKTGNVDWFDDSRAAEVKHLVNAVYGTSYPVRSGIGGGRIVGYTDWTHPGSR